MTIDGPIEARLQPTRRLGAVALSVDDDRRPHLQARVARVAVAQFDRVVATGAGEILPETVRVNRALSYRPVSTVKTEPIAPERAIHDEMRQAEERMARELAEREVLVVTDGPLTFQEATRGLAVGWVKRIQELYLPPAQVPVLLGLPAGARTPLFALRSSKRFARYSWFLRLAAPHAGDSGLSAPPLLAGFIAREAVRAGGRQS